MTTNDRLEEIREVNELTKDDDIAFLLAHIETLQEALEWYADEGNWQVDKRAHPLDVDIVSAHYDKGNHARAALAAEIKEPEGVAND